MEDDLKQCGFFNEPSSIPRFYTPKWIDRIVNKYGIYKDMWPCMVGLFAGLLPLLISLVIFKIAGM